MTRRRTASLLAVAAVAVVGAGVAVVVATNRTPAATGGVASDKQVMIDAGDISLSAEVVTPRGESRPPVVVMPASWGQPATQYRAIARDLADRGYLVVSYAQRGMGKSGGRIDFAGSATQRDVGKVIDYALNSAKGDPKRVGLYGSSYGAGVSLLAAAKDPRVKAVAALSTWTDIARSYDPNRTPSIRALAITLGQQRNATREDATVRGLRTLLRGDPDALGARIRQLSPTRSPMTYVDALNRNGTAVMLANGFGDSLFPPQQLVSFYGKLTTKKRLQLAPGDHGGPEASAPRGDDSSVANAARAWLDQYVRGVDSGIAREAPIALTDANTGAVHTLRSWPRNALRDRIALGEPNSKTQTGAGGKVAWSSTILAGIDTAATSGSLVAPFGSYTAPTASLLTLTKAFAVAWTGPSRGEPVTLLGTPQVRVNLASAARSATVVAYLYDGDQEGTGQLISVQPYSLTGLRPGRARAVTIDLQPVAWTIPNGHRVVLVLDTVDPRYAGLNAEGARITVSATDASPASLSIPKQS